MVLFMKTLLQQLSDIVGDAFVQEGFDRTFGAVVLSQRKDLGDVQCNGALIAGKQTHQSPQNIAEKIIVRIMAHPAVTSASVAGNGFINITVADPFLKNIVEELRHDERCGVTPTAKPRAMLVDFGGLNIAKPMHVGHLRSLFIGDALQRIFRFVGDDVTSDIHMGDWGTQMGMIMMELKHAQPSLPYFQQNFSGVYPVVSPVTLAELEMLYPAASARCRDDKQSMQEALATTVALQAGDPGLRALWKHIVNISLAQLKKDIAFLDIHFDLWNSESTYHDSIPALIQRLEKSGAAQESEAALIIPLPPDGAHELPPLMLRKSDGAFLYATTDLAALDYRVHDLHRTLLVYVVDARQSLHFEQLFTAARKIGVADDAILVHAGFGTVNGKDGKPFKTRAGGTMKLSDLITTALEKARERMNEAAVAKELPMEERTQVARLVGLAALKFADLINHRMSDYMFDVEKFTRFEGKTGPYLLYTTVRMKSLLRKSKEQNIAVGTLDALASSEHALLLHLAQFPHTIRDVCENYTPHLLADFLFQLAALFNTLYHHQHILNESDAARRGALLALTQACLQEMELGLKLLGITVPERM